MSTNSSIEVVSHNTCSQKQPFAPIYYIVTFSCAKGEYNRKQMD